MRGCACGKRARLCFSVKGVFHVKRTFAILLSAALLLTLLPACNQQGAAQPTQPSDTASPEATVSAPAESGLSCTLALSGVLSTLDLSLSDGEMLCGDGDGEANDRERLAAYISGAYGLDEGEWEDAAVTRATGANATELAVLRFADEDAARHGEESLKDYLHGREGDFTGYAPEQAALAADGVVSRQGKYLGLFICEDSGQAADIFEEILRTGEPLSSLPPTELVTEPSIDDDIDALLERMLDTCASFGDDVSDVERINSGETDELDAIIQGEYGLEAGSWQEAAIARGKGSSVFELALLRFRDDREGTDAVPQLLRYLDAKEEEYVRFPAQAELLNEANAWVPENTGCIILVVGANPMGTAFALGSYLTSRDCRGLRGAVRHFESAPVPSLEPAPNHPDREKFTPPGKEDMSIYDTAAIRAAWAAEDPSGLSDYDRAVYDAAREILGEILTDGMGDLEKEEAIYHWLVNHVDYDWRHQDFMAQAPRSSYEPYGGLVDRVAVCLGYAASFQLLCDLAGVECITVVGAAFHSEEEHAWNMVRLNGNWYCVDVTWDANGREQLGPGEPEDWRYFNLTSDELAARSHQWDYDNVPEATAADRGRS